MTGNSFLLQLIADLLGVKAVNISLEEVSALGAAYMAGFPVFRTWSRLPQFSKGSTYARQ
jgi:glycerol kinase